MKNYKVIKGYNGRPFSLKFGSHTQNPNGKSMPIAEGELIEFDEVAPNGNVWFYYKGDRGKSESGSIENMVKAGVIEAIPIEAGDKVKFLNDIEGENQFDITVVELRGERVLISTDIGNGKLNPTKNVLLSHLVLATEVLAKEFSRVLTKWIGTVGIQKVNELNKAEGYSNDVCHSHDFCDSNMAMDEAFTKVMGRQYVFFNDDEPETRKQNEVDTDLINEAWTIAKRNNFAN